MSVGRSVSEVRQSDRESFVARIPGSRLVAISAGSVATEPRGIGGGVLGKRFPVHLVDGGSMSFKHVSPRRVVATIGLLAAGIALFVPLSMSASSESACEAMARWAADYEHTTPAPTLDELAKFDRGRRVAIFNAVSADVKASLFQEQLRRFSQRADLTDTQRELIAEGLTLITPALYLKEPATSQSLRQFWSRADSSFTAPDQRRPWMDIGSNVASYELSHSALAGFTRTSLVPCECNVSWQDCGGWNCLSDGCQSGGGCGPLGHYTCNGTCYPPGTPQPASVARRD